MEISVFFVLFLAWSSILFSAVVLLWLTLRKHVAVLFSSKRKIGEKQLKTQVNTFGKFHGVSVTPDASEPSNREQQIRLFMQWSRETWFLRLQKALGKGGSGWSDEFWGRNQPITKELKAEVWHIWPEERNWSQGGFRVGIEQRPLRLLCIHLTGRATYGSCWNSSVIFLTELGWKHYKECFSFGSTLLYQSQTAGNGALSSTPGFQ